MVAFAFFPYALKLETRSGVHWCLGWSSFTSKPSTRKHQWGGVQSPWRDCLGPFPGRVQPQRSDLVSYRHARRLNSEVSRSENGARGKGVLCGSGGMYIVDSRGRSYFVHLSHLYASSLQFLQYVSSSCIFVGVASEVIKNIEPHMDHSEQSYYQDPIPVIPMHPSRLQVQTPRTLPALPVTSSKLRFFPWKSCWNTTKIIIIWSFARQMKAFSILFFPLFFCVFFLGKVRVGDVYLFDHNSKAGLKTRTRRVEAWNFDGGVSTTAESSGKDHQATANGRGFPPFFFLFFIGK